MELYGGDDLSFAHQVPLQLPVASNDRRWRRWLHGWRARSCALAFMRLWASHTFWPLRLLSTIGRRICCNYELDDGGSEARWCAGEVIVSRPLRCAVTSPSTVKPRVTERKRGIRYRNFRHSGTGTGTGPGTGAGTGIILIQKRTPLYN